MTPSDAPAAGLTPAETEALAIGAISPEPAGIALRLGAFSLRLRAWYALPGLLALVAAVYAPALFTWFNTDDILFVHAARSDDGLTLLRDALDFRNAPPPPEVRFYRPFHAGAFIGLERLFGLEAFGYHLWSLALHLLNTSLVWLIAHKLTRRGPVAGLAAAIFALHPAYVGAVVWVSNNNALMAMAAALLAFLCFMNAEEGRDRWRLWYAASVTAYAASLLFHPEVGTLILVLVAYRLLIVMPDWRDALDWRAWLDFVPFGAIAAGYLAIHAWMVNRDFLPQAELFEVEWHLIRVFLGYLAASVYPRPENQLALDTPAHVVALAGLLSALAFVLVWNRERRLALFAVVWFLVSVAPLSTTPIFGSEVWGRKLYVAGPALGFVLALGVISLVDALRARWSAPARHAAQAALAMAALLALVGAAWLIVDRQEPHADASSLTERFVIQLRETHPTLTAGTRLYVVQPPGVLAILPEIYVPPLVDLYYDDVDVVVTNEGPTVVEDGAVLFKYDRER